jgi:hypothetical protein
VIVTVTVYLNAPYRNIVSTTTLDAISVTNIRASNLISTIGNLLHSRRRVLAYRYRSHGSSCCQICCQIERRGVLGDVARAISVIYASRRGQLA